MSDQPQPLLQNYGPSPLRAACRHWQLLEQLRRASVARWSLLDWLATRRQQPNKRAAGRWRQRDMTASDRIARMMERYRRLGGASEMTLAKEESRAVAEVLGEAPRPLSSARRWSHSGQMMLPGFRPSTPEEQQVEGVGGA